MAATDTPLTKVEMINIIVSKHTAFSSESEATSKEGIAILDTLETLNNDLEGMSDTHYTPDYARLLFQRHPFLRSTTLVKAVKGEGPVKVTRVRGAHVLRCELCDGLVSNGSCVDCQHATSVAPIAISKTKTPDSATSRREFDNSVRTLAGLIDPPSAVSLKIPAIIDHLHREGYETVVDVILPIDVIRSAFTAVELKSHYIWCVAARFLISNYRPEPFSVEEMDKFHSYYVTLVKGIFERMSQHPVDTGKAELKNLWNIQARLKVIILMSPSLLSAHGDFFDGLHAQGENTENNHCEIVNSMANQANPKWVFP